MSVLKKNRIIKEKTGKSLDFEPLDLIEGEFQKPASILR